MTQNKQLFLLLTIVFTVAMLVVGTFQYQRERAYQISKLDAKIEMYNSMLYAYVQQNDSIEQISHFVAHLPDTTLRITLIDTMGVVLYDSKVPDYETLENHSTRPEIKAAAQDELASGIRLSSTTSESYYYVAQRFGGMYVRTAVPYSITLRNMLSPNRSFIFLIAFMLLITIAAVYFIATHLSKKQQVRDNEMRRKLTQNISHELKTPVASIMGYMESLLNNPMLEEDRRQFYIERSYFQAKRLAHLIQDINTLNKLNDQHQLYEIADCDLAELIRTTISDVKLQIEENYCSLNLDFPDCMPISGNQVLLYSIFRNLLDNTLAYADRHAHIDIKLINQDAYSYQISFADSGAGIPADHLPHIFDRFYRVDNGRSRKAGGTGLGLSIVKNAIAFHGGTIFAENKPNAGGLRFIFTLRKKQ